MFTVIHRRSSHWVLVLAPPLAALGITLLAWQSARVQAIATAQHRLEDRARLLAADLGDALTSYEHLIRNIRAHFDASEAVEIREWHVHLRGISVDRRYPAIREILWVEAVPGEPGLRIVTRYPGDAEVLSDAADASMIASIVDRAGAESPSLFSPDEHLDDPHQGSTPWLALLCLELPRNEAGLGANGGPRRWMVARIDVPTLVAPLVERHARGMELRIAAHGSAFTANESQAHRPLSQQATVRFGGEEWSVVLRAHPGDLIESPAASMILGGGIAGSVVVAIVMMLLLRSQQHALVSRRSEIQLQSALDSVTNYAILLLDHSGKISGCNVGTRRVFGYEKGELLGQTLHPFYPAEADAPGGGPAMELEVAAKEGRVEVENWRIRKDGSRFWASTVITAVHDQGSRLTGYIQITRDMTERKRVEEQLAESNRDLARSNNELQQFAYVASHDLQEPLRAVSSYLQLIERRYKDRLDENASEFIGFAVEGALRMKRLINDLLDYSRAGTRETSFESLDAGAELTHVTRELRAAIQESGATITHGPLPTIVADAGQFRQLLMNLMGNSIKFRREGHPPEIEVSARPEDGGWVFTVRDNGIGIAPEYSTRIFEIFQRLHTRDRYPGTGIGLAICKRIVDRHRGRIWVEPGGGIDGGPGAAFCFFLPANLQQNSGATHAA